MVIIKPLITEKTMGSTAQKRYGFLVDIMATKTEIKKEVEKLFKVKVVKIQTTIRPGKRYRLGKRWMFRHKNDSKKAIITVSKDQKIELFDAAASSESK